MLLCKLISGKTFEITATSVPTGKGCGPDKVYVRGKSTYHKALEVVLELDILEQSRAGNKAIINYNNIDGWKRYKKISDKYAQEIRETVKKYKNKNDRQGAFKQIMHRLDVECFGIKYRKSKSSGRKMGKYNAK